MRCSRKSSTRGLRAGVGSVDEDGAFPQQSAAFIQDHPDDGVQQRMAGTEEVGLDRAGLAHQRLVEADAVVAFQHRHRRAQRLCPVADARGHVTDPVAPGLALVERAAQPRECLHKEGLNVVRLQPPCGVALHLLADAHDLAGIHRLGGQRPRLQ